MTDQELKDLVASIAVMQAETAAQSVKTDAQMAKSDAKLEKLMATVASVGKQLGGMGRSQGAVAEEFFYNSLRANPVLEGVTYQRVMPHVQISVKKKQAEFDIVMLNGKSVAVIEVKYKVHENDIAQVEKSLKAYRAFYPEHKNFDLYGGIAGFNITPEVAQAAKAKGLFVLKRKGDVFTTDATSMRAF
jgi:hypothetical protein